MVLKNVSQSGDLREVVPPPHFQKKFFLALAPTKSLSAYCSLIVLCLKVMDRIKHVGERQNSPNDNFASSPKMALTLTLT